MRVLKIAVVVMGILIVVGTATLAILIARRLSPPSHPLAASLAEPPGSRITASAISGDRLVLVISGGGPDRAVVVDLRSLRPTARLNLTE